MNSKTFYQAVLFGIVVILLGLILSMAFSFLKPELASECENWDKYYVMEVVLFLTGFIIRYGLEHETIKMYLYSESHKHKA
jgi:hypothetical protein